MGEGSLVSLLWLPTAVRDQHSSGLTWTETTDPKGCLHTTETSGWPSYQGWTVEPHATIMPLPNRGIEIRQHIDFGHGSFSLRHTQSQPTNTDFVFQFELIGTSDPNGSSAMYFWPEADDTVLKALLDQAIRPLSDAYGIPLKAPKFLAYPASFGATSVRMSNSTFDTYTGWLGHEHVPQNDHGDPGLFPWSKMIGLNQMPLTQAEYDAISNENWNGINIPYKVGDHSTPANPANPNAEQTPASQLGSAARWSEWALQVVKDSADSNAVIHAAVNALSIKLDALNVRLNNLPDEVVAALPPASTGGITIDDVKSAVTQVAREGI